MLARSYLFAPGDNEKLLRKVFNARADAVVLDLEDAVAPDRKAAARQMIAAALDSAPATAPFIFIRINGLDTPHWQEDLACAVHPRAQGIRIAKAESVAALQAAGQAIAALERARELTVGALRLVLTIESALGVMNAAKLAEHPRVAGFAFGAADFVKDIGAENDAGETATLWARAQLVLVSRAAGLHPPIASVYTKLNDDDGLRASTQAQRRLGFFGRSCIHPAQLPIIHEVFTPSAAQLAEARAILAAVVSGQAVATLPNGQFIDAPIIERARQLIALSERFR